MCPYFVNEGFPDLQSGWLKPAIDAVHRSGGLFIADEVQPGFGRLGSHFWGHQYQGVKPDIVTLGKPMANGHPVGAVVTSKDIMTTFRKAFRYFNTFGGNPVSCAAAMAVLDEIDRMDLTTNAIAVGNYAISKLNSLRDKHSLIGDVRGKGMLFGAELVLDRSSKEPATEMTAKLVNLLRDRGIILSSLGRHKNILKIRPPMPFSADNVDLLVETLDGALHDLAAR